MRIDLYTKIVLTVIAACLVALVLRDGTSVASAQAQTEVQKVEIIGIDSELGLPVELYRVRVESTADLLPVHIVAISRPAFRHHEYLSEIGDRGWDPIPVTAP